MIYIDMWKLIARTIKDTYILPRIDETLDCLNGEGVVLFSRFKIWVLANRGRRG